MDAVVRPADLAPRQKSRAAGADATPATPAIGFPGSRARGGRTRGFVNSFDPLGQGRQADEARPSAPGGLRLGLVIGLGQRDVELGVLMDQMNFVAEARLVETGHPEQDPAIGARLERDAHEHAVDGARDLDALAAQQHGPAAAVGASVRRFDPCARRANPGRGPNWTRIISRQDFCCTEGLPAGRSPGANLGG